MKKLLIALLIALLGVPLILGGVLLYGYTTTDEDSVPNITLQAMGATVPPAGYSWHVPVFGGMMYKDFEEKTTLEATNLGNWSEPRMEILFPAEYESRVSVMRGTETVWNGSAEEWADYVFTDNGDFIIHVTSELRADQSKTGYGSFVFRFACRVEIEPVLEPGTTRVQQGDVLAVRVRNLTGGTTPTGSSEVGPVNFTPSGAGHMTAYIPVSYNTDPGSYTVSINAGFYSWEFDMTVAAYEFTTQTLEMDNADPVISEANSPAAYQQYRDMIYPVFEMTDPATYWEGPFLQPVEGRISTEYGLVRTTNYTDGSTATSRHAGMDYSAEAGTPVYAPNHGVVVFSEYLLNTGNTIVIEHGGGLKTYYFHLDSRAVEVGDSVLQSQQIGTVGSTGYSTGPHLHYEVRIGNKSINPEWMYHSESGFYTFARED